MRGAFRQVGSTAGQREGGGVVAKGEGEAPGDDGVPALGAAKKGNFLTFPLLLLALLAAAARSCRVSWVS